MKKFKRFLIPLFAVLVIFALLSPIASNIGYPGGVGEVEHPSGNPFAHRFSDESNEFIELLDTPSSFSGEGGKLLRVNTTPDASEFTNFDAIWVAANGSSAAEKAKALASGGTVCTLANDEVDFETAMATAGAGGEVNAFPGRTYELDAMLDIDEGCHLNGNGAILAITGDDYDGVYIQSSANYVIGSLRNAIVTTTASYAKSAVKVQPQHNIWGYHGILENIWVVSDSFDDITAGSVGIEIVCSADNTGDNRYINFSSFGPAFIQGFEKGARIFIYRRTSGSAYFNDNTINFQIENSKYLFDIEIDGDSTEPFHACQGNNITLKLQPEWGGQTETGIRTISTDDERIIKDRFFVSGWDWSHANSYFIQLSAYTEWCHFSGKLLFMADSLAAASFISDANGTNSFYDENQDVMLIGQPDQFTYHGVGLDTVIAQGTITADYAWGDVCYLSTATSKWVIADADDGVSSKDRIGILVSEPTAADQTVFILLRGHLDYGGWAWTTGDELWLSTTAGDVTATIPSGAGDIMRFLGYAVEDDVIYFVPSELWFEMDAGGQIVKINGIAISETP